MYAFDYHRPQTLRQAVNLLGRAEDAKILAGGQTLIPTLKARLARPLNLIDLSAIPEMRAITQTSRALVIGALARHADVTESVVVRQAIPALADLAHLIGDPHVRNRGTIGGSIANNDPAADYPAALLALDATIVTTRRKIAADAFFQGMFTTALEDGELVTALSFPIPSRAAYVKFRNPASRYALVGVFVAVRRGETRVAVTGASNGGVYRWSEAEAALKPRFSLAAIERLAKPSTLNMNADIHASAAYRAHLVHVMTKRAVTKALGR